MFNLTLCINLFQQNAEDNKYKEGVTPSLEFVITSKDITMTGASSTLLLFNNEIGFSPANIDSICRIGKSTKKGRRHLGYIGEKGMIFNFIMPIDYYVVERWAHKTICRRHDLVSYLGSTMYLLFHG